MSNHLSLQEAKEVISLSDRSYSLQVLSVGATEQQVTSARRAWNNLVGAQTSTQSQIRQQTSTLCDLQTTLSTQRTYLKALDVDRRNAQTVLNENISLPGPELASDVNAFVGPTGPTGPKGLPVSTPTAPTGPTGEPGTTWSSAEARCVGSLYISSSLNGDSAVLDNLRSTLLTSTSGSFGEVLVVGSTVVPGDNLSAPTLLATSQTCTSMVSSSAETTDMLVRRKVKPLMFAEEGYDYNNSGNVTVQTLNPCTLFTPESLVACSGMVGTMLSGTQSSVTSVGTLHDLDINGNCTASSASVSGLCTSSYLQGTLQTSNQSNITSLGVLGTLSVTGMLTIDGSTNLSGICTAYGGIDGTFLSNSHPQIVQLGQLTSATITGACTCASFSCSGDLVVDSNLNGVITTPVQSNITSLGTLPSIAVTGRFVGSSVSVSGLCTSSGGLYGLSLSPIQTRITHMGVLTSLAVNGSLYGTTVNVSGVCTSTGGFVGTFLTVSQPNVTSLGSLSSLAVSSTATCGNTVQQSHTGTNAFISSSSTKYNLVQLNTDGGSVQYKVGMQSNTGAFYLSNLQSATQPLTIDSSGRCGLNSSGTTHVRLDTGSSTQSLGSLVNPQAYVGVATSGVVFGSGTGNSAPYVAASRMLAGTSVSLSLNTNGSEQVRFTNTGAVVVTSSNLTVGGTSFGASTYGSASGLGYEQSWVNVTSGRAFNTVYTNSTQRPIGVSIYLSGNNWTSRNQFALFVDNVKVDLSFTRDYIDFLQLKGVVPVNSTYNIINYNGLNTAAVVALWSELR